MIRRLIIKNFRSIEELDIELSKLNALVGPNNSGKSNIMDALNIIIGTTWPSSRSFDDKDFRNYNKSNPIVIEVTFDQALTTDSSVVGFRLRYDGEDFSYIPFDRDGNQPLWPSGYPKRISNNMKDEVSLMYLGLDRQAHAQIRATTWTIYGKLLRFIERSIENAKKTTFESGVQTAYDTNLAPELTDFIESVKEFTKEQTGLDLDFRFKTIDPIEVLKNLRPYIKDPFTYLEHDIEMVGSGTQSALAIAIARAYAQIVKMPLVMAIEEPELYLHPHACRHFYKLLKELSESLIQVIYTTHERCFVNVIDYENIYLVRNIGGKTYVNCGIGLTSTPSDTFIYASKCDESMNEMFFANHVVLVEGFPDKIACHLALEQQGINLDKRNISIIECGGKDDIIYIAKILKRFEIPCYTIFDEDPSNPDTRRRIDEAISLLGSDFVLLQSPNLEGLFSLPNKPKKHEALQIFPQWFTVNPVPQIYIDLKNKI